LRDKNITIKEIKWLTIKQIMFKNSGVGELKRCGGVL